MSDQGRNPVVSNALDKRLDRRALLRTGGAVAAGLGAAAVLPSRRGGRARAAQSGGCSGDDVTLTYGYWDTTQQPGVDAQIAAFEEKYPNISINLQPIPWGDYWTKLQTGVAGGSTHDVFWMTGAEFPVYAAQGALVDVQPIIGDGGVDLSAFPQSLIDLYTNDGKVYGVVRDLDTIGLYYNKELFDAAEVAYPTAEWTWQDLRAAAEQLTIKDGDTTTQWGYGSTLSVQQNLFNFIPQNGGQFFNADRTQSLLNEPAACEAILFVTDMILDGLSPSVAEQQTSDPYESLFPAGKIAMIPGGSWHAGRLYETNPAIDVAPLPQGKQRATMIHGLANVVWSGTEHMCEALEFVKFLGGREAEQLLADTATVIPAMSGLQEAWRTSVPEANLQVFLDAVDYSVPFPSAPTGIEWVGNVEGAMVDTWSGDIPRDQACQRFAEAANAAL